MSVVFAWSQPPQWWWQHFSKNPDRGVLPYLLSPHCTSLATLHLQEGLVGRPELAVRLRDQFEDWYAALSQASSIPSTVTQLLFFKREQLLQSLFILVVAPSQLFISLFLFSFKLLFWDAETIIICICLACLPCLSYFFQRFARFVSFGHPKC